MHCEQLPESDIQGRSNRNIQRRVCNGHQRADRQSAAHIDPEAERWRPNQFRLYPEDSRAFRRH